MQNKLKYNFSGRFCFLQDATVTGINTNWFENFQRGSSYGEQFFREFFPLESRIGSSLREFRIIEGSRNRG